VNDIGLKRCLLLVYDSKSLSKLSAKKKQTFVSFVTIIMSSELQGVEHHQCAAVYRFNE
jgi:hypothetical protein